MIGLQNKLWYTAYFVIYGVPIICGGLGYYLKNYIFT